MRPISAITVCLFLVITAPSLLSGGPAPYPNEQGSSVLSDNNRGDVNEDGRLNILDLLELLRHLQSGKPYTTAADPDSSGRVDIFDLLVLLRLFAEQPEPEEELDFMLVIHYLRVYDYSKVEITEIFELPQHSTSYEIYCSREIDEVLFVFGQDTVTEAQGDLPDFFDKDTLSGKLVELGRYPWYLRLTDSGGNWKETTGEIEFSFEFNGLIDGHYRWVGNPISLPLVLYGPDQRFALKTDPWSAYTFEIDLNRSRADSVIFTGIDSLATTIMDELVSNSLWEEWRYGKWFYDILSVCPAIDQLSGGQTARLVIVNMGIGGWPVIEPAGGNVELTSKLGFPRWLREIPQAFYDSRYIPDYGWIYSYRPQ